MDIESAPRNQVDSKLAGLELVRSSIWFDDGNIISVAAGSAAFKVHRGQLERHSEVFYDLFSIPPPKEQVLSDGCFSFTRLFFIHLLDHNMLFTAGTSRNHTQTTSLRLLPFSVCLPNTLSSIFASVA
jgi:hypothetical protein